MLGQKGECLGRIEKQLNVTLGTLEFLLGLGPIDQGVNISRVHLCSLASFLSLSSPCLVFVFIEGTREGQRERILSRLHVHCGAQHEA